MVFMGTKQRTSPSAFVIWDASAAEPAGVGPCHCCPDRGAITGESSEQTGLVR